MSLKGMVLSWVSGDAVEEGERKETEMRDRNCERAGGRNGDRHTVASNGHGDGDRNQKCHQWVKDSRPAGEHALKPWRTPAVFMGAVGRTTLDTMRATWIPLISDMCHGNRACRPRPGVGRGAGVLSKEEVERDSFGRVTDFDLYLICTQIKPFGILTLISTGSVLVSERGLPRLPTGPRR